MNKKQLLILGTGTFALETADIALDTGEFEICGFVESLNREKQGHKLENLPIYWIEELSRFSGRYYAVCGVGSTLRADFIKQAQKAGLEFATIIHPSAHISKQAQIGCGCIIGAGTVIASYTQLENHVILNRGALVGHHTKIGSYVSIGPGANIAGNCIVNDAVYVGMGAVVINGVEIGSHSVIAAGAVVTKNVPPHVQVMGMPAKVTKENIEGM